MAKRYRRDSYGNHDARDEEHVSYDSYRPKSPHQNDRYKNTYTPSFPPRTKTWVNPNLKAKPFSATRDYSSNRYNDSGNFREDSRSVPSDDRSLASRSPQYKSPPSPPSPSPPPSRRHSDQLSHHPASDSRPLPPSSKLSFSLPSSGNAKKRDHADFQDGSEAGSSPGFNIRGLSSLQPNKADNANGVKDTDTDLAAMGPKDTLSNKLNGNHDPTNGPTEESLSQLELLVKHLSQFAGTLSADACLISEQEVVEAKLAKVQQERDKWRNHHSSFASLFEDTEKEIRDHKATLARVKDRQRVHRGKQDNAIRLMATTLLATRSIDPLPQLDGRRPVDTLLSRLESLEIEFPEAITTIRGAAESNSWEIKSKLAEVEKAQQTVKADLHAFISENNDSQRSVHQQFENKVAQLNSQLSNIDVPSAISKEFGNAGINVKELRGYLDEIPKLVSAQGSMGQNLRNVEEDVRGYKSQRPLYDSLAEKLDTLSERFHRLNVEVVGDGPENPSLLATLEDFEKNLHQVAEEIQQVHKNIATVQDDMDEINKKARGLSGGSAPPRPNSEQPSGMFPALSQRLDALEKVLEEHFATLRKEADLKDEMVAEEVEGINNRITVISDQGQYIRAMFDKLQSTIGLQPTKSGAEMHTANGVGPEKINGVSHSHEQHTSTYIPGSAHSTMTDALREHSSVLESHHNFLVDLQSKFNNLTSDELASKMAVQLQKLYPFASTVQNDIVGFKHNLNSLQLGLNHVGGIVFNLDGQASQRAKWDMETRNVVESVKNDLTALQTTLTTVTETATAHATKLEGHETRLSTQEADVAKFSRAFENAKSEATQQLGALGESIAALENKLANLDSDARRETSKMHSKVALMWKERPKENIKMASPVCTSPKSGSPTASPSAPPSPRKLLHMRKKDKSHGKAEDGEVVGGSEEEEPSKKRARVEAD